MSVLDEQEHRVYDPDTGRPVTRPDLLAQERHAVDTDGDGGFYHQDDGRPSRQHGEEHAGGDAAKDSFYKMDKAHKEEEARNTFRNRMRARLGNSSGSKAKYLLAGGIGATLIILVLLAFFLFSLFGSLKVIHFATVLRSAGLARFTLQMQKQYDRTLFDAATLTDSSTGKASKELGDRSMLQKMLGINPQKRLAQLGQEDFLKFEFESSKSWNKITNKNTFKGVEINGEAIRLDDLAQAKYGKDYAKLSRGQTRDINKAFRDKVRTGLSDRLSLEGLSYRSSVYAGIRQLAGIRMIKWPEKNKAEQGMTDAKALEDDVQKTADAVDNGEQAPSSGIKEVQDQADEVKQKVADASKKGQNVSNIRAKSADIAGSAKKVSTGALLATGACIVHDLNNSFQEASKNTELKADRLGHDALTAGDQIKQGDVNATAVGAEATRWGSADKSALYKQQTGEGGYSDADMTQLSTIPDIRGPVGAFKTMIQVSDSIIKSTGGPLSINSLPFIGNKATDLECDVVLHPLTQYGIAGGELVAAVASAGIEEGFLQAAKTALSGGIQLAAGVGIGDLLGRLIDSAVHSYAGTDYSGYDNNEKLYNESYVGVDSLGQYGNRQVTFGKPITAAEASSQQQEAMAATVAMNKERPFMQRYFAIDNPNSLLGNVAAAVPTNANGVSSYAQRGLASIGSLFSSPQLLLQRLGSIFLPHTMAAANQMATGANFGVDESGWTADENAKLDNDPNFSNAANTTYVEGGGMDNYNNLMNKYSRCYTYERQSEKPSECTEAYLSTGEALHWRAYMAEICSASSLAGNVLDAPTNADLINNCTEAPTGGTAAPTTATANANIDMAHLYDPSNNVACAPGTENLGVVGGSFSGMHNGKPVIIRLCRIPGFKCSCAQSMTKYTEGNPGLLGTDKGTGPNGAIDSKGDVAVNSRVSGAWLALFTKAKADGVTMQSNSAFRTNAYQQSLCPCDGRTVARPGYSNHQMGLALDLAGAGYAFINYGDRYHDWMKANAAQFGLKQYPVESWHWSPTGN